MRVCSVNGNTGICWFYLDYWLIRRTLSKKNILQNVKYLRNMKIKLFEMLNIVEFYKILNIV